MRNFDFTGRPWGNVLTVKDGGGGVGYGNVLFEGDRVQLGELDEAPGARLPQVEL